MTSWTIFEKTTNMENTVSLEMMIENDALMRVYDVEKDGQLCITVIHDMNQPDNLEVYGIEYDSIQNRVDTAPFVKIVLSFIVNLLKADNIPVDLIYFTDKSMIPFEHQKYHLANYYFLLHTQSWYEAKFHAHPTRYFHLFEEYKIKLLTPIQDIQHFVNTVFSDLSYQDELIQMCLESDVPMTYVTFFNKCVIVYGYGMILQHQKKIYEYLDIKYSLFNTTDFVIESTDVETWSHLYSIEMVNTATTGGKRTRSKSIKRIHRSLPHV